MMQLIGGVIRKASKEKCLEVTVFSAVVFASLVGSA